MISIANVLVNRFPNQNFLGKGKNKKGKLSYLLAYDLENMFQMC